VARLADSTTRDVRAVLITGPLGVLWEYRVLTVIDTVGPTEPVISNHLLFPHARITFKSKREVPRDEFGELLQRIESIPILRQVVPEDSTGMGDFATIFALATFGDSVTIRLLDRSVADSNPEPLDSLMACINLLIGGEGMKKTYRH